MLPRRVATATLLASVLVLVLGVLPAAGFDLSNCTLNLTSLDADGTQLDTAQGPGSGGTIDDPFVVDWDGTVRYDGTTGTMVLMNNSWHIDVFLIPTPLRGGDPNTGGDTTGEDTVGVGENAPIDLAGLFFVSGDISSPDGSCAGSGWFLIDEDPFTTLPFWTAVGLTLLSLLFLWYSQPTWRPA